MDSINLLELQNRVVRARDARDVARDAAMDIWSILASTNLWAVCYWPPTPFGLPPGTVSITVTWVERSKKIVKDTGSETWAAGQTGESQYPRVIEILAKHWDAETLSVAGNGFWSFSPYYVDAVVLSLTLGQGKARQRGTIATRNGLNAMAIRVPHR